MALGDHLDLVFVASILGFTAFVLLDVPAVYRRPRVAALLSAGGIFLLALAFVWSSTAGKTFALPFFWVILGWALMAVAVAFTVFVVFVEIPWRLACAGRSEGLVMSGTYAACRHPGFWGVVAFALGSSLAFHRTGVVALALLWIVLEWWVVWVQDRWLLRRRFTAYRIYQEHVPFLVPTRSSLQNARRSWPCRRSKSYGNTQQGERA